MADDREQTPGSEGRAPDAGKGRRELTSAAQRALQEAAARRARQDEQARAKAAQNSAGQAEHGGREGPDPVRYGDWENGGIVSDF